jgi:hypothetical protein
MNFSYKKEDLIPGMIFAKDPNYFTLDPDRAKYLVGCKANKRGWYIINLMTSVVFHWSFRDNLLEYLKRQNLILIEDSLNNYPIGQP